MQNGINLNKGKSGGDFSDGKGFYVTSDYMFAHRWPQKMMKKPNSAVVVFKIDNMDIFSNSPRKGKEFSEANSEWEKTVGYYRNNRDFKNWFDTKKKGKKVDSYHFIFGPISRDGKDNKMRTWKPRPRDPLIYELCLKDDLLAEDFYNKGRNIHKTIFFY